MDSYKIKKILVLTATLGNRETLKRTIDTVRIIGGNRVKHVIITPKEHISFIKEKYGDIECLAEPEGKKGIYAALNHGFNTYGHDYEYMTFINDDDYWLPDFKILIDAIINRDLDFVYAKTKYVNKENVFLSEQACSRRFHDFIALLNANIVMLTQQATIIRSQWYYKLNGFDESYKLVADSKFWAQLSLEKIKYKYFNCCCAAYTIQEGQLSSDRDTQVREKNRMLAELPQISSLQIGAAVARFRLINMNIYLKRILRNRHVLNQFNGRGCVKIVNIIVCMLPWRIKRWLLIYGYGYDIHKTAYIGLSYIFPKYLAMEAGARIGHLNVAINLDKLSMGCNAIIARNNWITGFPTRTRSAHFAHDKLRKAELIIGSESAITKNHHIDCTNRVVIGNYVTIAGYSSQLLTHSIDIYASRQDSTPIEIGDYCFIGTGVKILGGAFLPAYSVLAAGAVLTKMHHKEWQIYAGIPAKAIKEIPKESKYFSRNEGFIY